MSLVSGCFPVAWIDALRGPPERTSLAWVPVELLADLWSRINRSSTCCCVTTSSARSVWSFFSMCDRASTRPFVDARGPFVTSALGRDSPDTDKICSIVLRDSSPLHNQEHAWPNGQVKGTPRAGREPQGFARREAANQHRHKSRLVFSVMGSWMV